MIITSAAERLWLDDMLRWLLPYTVVDGNGSCPDTFVVTVTQKDQPPTQHTLHRKPGELDYAFWDRVLDVASGLTVRVQSENPPTLYNREQRYFQIQIRCCYDHITDTRSQNVEALEKMLLGIVKHSSDNEVRVNACGVLAQMYNMI